MASPTMTDEQIAEKYGRRNLPQGAVAFDQPQELGYAQMRKQLKAEGYLVRVTSSWKVGRKDIWVYKP